MSRSAIAKEAYFLNSIRKYLVDNLSVDLYFEPLTDTPTNDAGVPLSSWICVSFDDFAPGTLAENFVHLLLFTRNDLEGDDMAALSDTVLDIFIDEDSNTGVVSIPFYDCSDTPWVNIGGIVPHVQPLTASVPAKDSTRMRLISVRCLWGSK